MEFNKSLLMPVCIMVKTLKSGLNLTDCCLFFDLLGISHAFVHCQRPGDPRKPTLRQGGRGGSGSASGKGREGHSEGDLPELSLFGTRRWLHTPPSVSLGPGSSLQWTPPPKGLTHRGHCQQLQEDFLTPDTDLGGTSQHPLHPPPPSQLPLYKGPQGNCTTFALSPSPLYIQPQGP